MNNDKLTKYQKQLFVFLSVAALFEGYDFFALTQILPELRADFGLSKTSAGLMVAAINAGTVAAYFLVRKADHWGRKRVLSITIFGYALTSLLSGLAPNALVFTAAQFVARVFLIAEYATSMVYAAEEFPDSKRGLAIGVITACSALGGIVAAGAAPLLLETAFGWRTVYFIGVIPLLLLAYARRGLRESSRFDASKSHERRPFLAIFKSPYRARLLQLGLIWSVAYICNQTAVTFWKDFAVAERFLSKEQVGTAIAVAALVAMPLVFLVGPLIDKTGRRMGAVIVFVLSAAGVFFAYTLHGQWALTVPLAFGIFGASATLVVLNAFSTELFPTELRADAYAWTYNILGRVGYILAPLAVGAAADEVGWGLAVRSTAIFPLIALALILFTLPETKGKSLDEASAV